VSKAIRMKAGGCYGAALVRRRLLNVAKRRFLDLYRVAVRAGFHVLPAHYYVPVPNVIELGRDREPWARASELPGIDAPLDRQVDTLREICLPFQAEYAGNAAYEEGVRRNFGQGFGVLEAQAWHAVLRSVKPSRVVEIGSGVSSFCGHHALTRNARDGSPGTLVCVEPHPSAQLRALQGIELIPQFMQHVDLEVFTSLRAGDILFVDSSHTVKAGSDVNRIVLEILPRLAPGVLVHFHDIFLPFDHQPDLLDSFLHWNETSLVRAFLTNNRDAEFLFSMAMLHHGRPDALHEVFPGYRPQAIDPATGLRDPRRYPPFAPIAEHFPSSLYFRVTG
jgi:methyltransferase family protein